MASAPKLKHEPYPKSQYQTAVQDIYKSKTENPQLWKSLSDWDHRFIQDIVDKEERKEMLTITRKQIDSLIEMRDKFRALRTALASLEQD